MSTQPLQDSQTENCDPQTSVTPLNQKIYPAPSEQEISAKIACLNQDLNNKILARDIGLSGPNSQKDIKKKTRKTISSQTAKLKRLKNNAKYQRKHRAKQRKLLKNLKAQFTETSKDVIIQDEPGRPRLSDQLIIDHILKVVNLGSAADPRRRSITSTTCKTLDQLHQALLGADLLLSRSATYLRLQPRDKKTHQGKRHVVTAPVKLARPTADLHKSHQDTMFCTSTIRSLESLASMLGPDQVLFLSQDDKARVPIGITAANHQAPLLMSMEYRVRLPDHDWVVAERYKLIPSVIAGCRIAAGGMGDPNAVSYSGPTYVCIRSGKHSSSTASSHAADFRELLNVPCFKSLTRTPEDAVKPIVIFTVDGGPDENPRYGRVIAEAVKHFRENNLDAIFYATNAPGRSAFNRVERRMAPLSRQLAGVVLPHDTFGSHLDSRGRTTDEQLELQNFAAAGEALASIWSSTIIDGEEVLATFSTHPCESDQDGSAPIIPQEWYDKHVRESQYFLQIAKCGDHDCCGKLRSGIGTILPTGFFPPPCLIEQKVDSITAPPPNATLSKDATFCPLFVRLSLKISIPYEGRQVPYDFYCPSLFAVVQRRTCPICGLYFASEKNLQAHRRNRHTRVPLYTSARVRPIQVVSRRRGELLCVADHDFSGFTSVEWLPEEDVDGDVEVDLPEVDAIPIVENLEEWIASPWTDTC